MSIHSPVHILFIGHEHHALVAPFLAYLKKIRHLTITCAAALPRDLSGFTSVVTQDMKGLESGETLLEQFVRAGGAVLGFAGPSDWELPGIFGAQPVAVEPPSELRILFHDRHNPLAVRLPDAFYIRGASHFLRPAAADSEILLYADWHYEHQPVLITRHVGDGLAACIASDTCDEPLLQQILYRVLRQGAGHTEKEQTLGVGLLGYAPSVGQLHGMGVKHTAGLRLHAACDTNTERQEQASRDFSGIQLYASAAELAGDPEVDLVIIATPPNTHAALSLNMMQAGKHVVCEKPLALSRRETGAMLEQAEQHKVHLSCHQNRRFDQDYLAIRQALDQGMLGDLFYMETFVGGFSHPCGYWHSHAAISGGTAYDWGGHYLDWIVSLLPEAIETVRATSHKRVWHDVTNNDQERIQVRCAGGQEAEFMHSDIAAVRKPKWYLLGTQGAIIGRWKDVAAYDLDPVLYFKRHDIPATEMTPDLTLLTRHRSGQLVSQSLAVPPRQDFSFHRNLADHLLLGEPLVTPLEDSVTVVAVLEAASRSAARGGTVEKLYG